MASTDVSPFDNRLLEGASLNKSPVELSKSIGGVFSPAECALRVRSMLEGKAFWTDPEKKQLLLYRVYDLVDDLTTKAKKSEDSKDYSALIKGLDTLRKVLADQEGVTEAELVALVRLQAGAMLGYINAAMDHAVVLLKERAPEIPAALIEDTFEEAMVYVRAGD